MTPSRYGRVILYTTLNKKEDWFTALIIKDPRESDSGEYTFTVKQGLAVSTVARSLVVLSKQGQFHKKSFISESDDWIKSIFPNPDLGIRQLFLW